MQQMKASVTAARLLGRRDAELVERLAELDVSALADAYDAHAAAVYRLSLSIVGRQEDAEDVLQDVFLALVNGRARRIRNLKAYLLAAAHNRSISLLRRRKREIPAEDSLVSVPSGCLPEEHALYLALREALDELPVDQKEVIVLKIYCDLTFQEISRVVRASPNTVASRYRYAIEKLRRIIGGDANEK
jgi:RNA polymerase sigma-70 factor (ECF subfamily)